MTESASPPIRLALCIPFDSGDLHFLPQCLASIQEQILQPDLVVFSFSRIRPAQEALIHEGLRMFPLQPCTRVMIATERLLPGANRNRAAQHAIDNGATLLSFIDADDMMHPRRLELLVAAFHSYPELNGILHHYMHLPKRPTVPRAVPWPAAKGELVLNALRPLVSKKVFWRIGLHPDAGSADVHNGHVTVRASAWKAYPYREDMALGEDNHFNARILHALGEFGYFADALSAFLA